MPEDLRRFGHGSLFKVTGSGTLEESIVRRGPEYGDYLYRTNTLFPDPPERG